ncbi:unnamed protein product, partial [Rotaria magnacalcarata]
MFCFLIDIITYMHSNTFHIIIGPTIVKSIYSGELTYDSDQFFRTGNTNSYYYQAIDIIVNITGNYTVKSNSTIDTFGYLYIYSFNKTKLSINQVTKNDDKSGSLQFTLISALQSGVRYIVIVTTYSPDVRGPFSITVSGPATVGFHVNTAATKPSSSVTTTTRTTTTTTRTTTTTTRTTTTTTRTTTTTSKASTTSTTST